MEFTEEQIKKLAEEYSSVFKKAHEKDFIAGFKKTVEILLQLEKAKPCKCLTSLDAENCITICKNYVLENMDYENWQILVSVLDRKRTGGV